MFNTNTYVLILHLSKNSINVYMESKYMQILNILHEVTNKVS